MKVWKVYKPMIVATFIFISGAAVGSLVTNKVMKKKEISEKAFVPGLGRLEGSDQRLLDEVILYRRQTDNAVKVQLADRIMESIQMDIEKRRWNRPGPNRKRTR